MRVFHSCAVILVLSILVGWLYGVHETRSLTVCTVNVLHDKYYAKHSTVPLMDPSVRLSIFKDWILKQGPHYDIIALQEFPHGNVANTGNLWMKVVEDFAEREGKHVLFHPNTDAGILLLVSNKLTVNNHTVFSFPGSGSSKAYSHTYLRYSNRDVLVINAHVPWKPEVALARAAVKLMFPTTDAPVIAMGDWNVELSDAELAASIPANFTRIASANEPTCISPSAESIAIDYIVVGGSVGCSSKSVTPHIYELVRHNGEPPHFSRSWFSDHAAVAAVLSVD
eukprot:TRINITY_DN2499_c0_g1_i3.p1 TRINITY_DN2499_c0_g1~~TRINITY_DN2499_c0_g1_i3.p1  ORF type:complete len:282 (+),score=30.39 TRINITY_DN2499_c0_g1_i3:42-887(+)